MISLRVDSATQVEMTSTHAHADIGAVDPSSIWQDMRQRTLCSEFTITLEALSVSCRFHRGPVRSMALSCSWNPIGKKKERTGSSVPW